MLPYMCLYTDPCKPVGMLPLYAKQVRKECRVFNNLLGSPIKLPQCADLSLYIPIRVICYHLPVSSQLPFITAPLLHDCVTKSRVQALICAILMVLLSHPLCLYTLKQVY